MTQKKPEWIGLQEAYSRLREATCLQTVAEEALAKAILQGGVPIRGVPVRGAIGIFEPAESIDAKTIRAPKWTDIDQNQLRLNSWSQGVDFHSVETEWKALAEFACENYATWFDCERLKRKSMRGRKPTKAKLAKEKMQADIDAHGVVYLSDMIGKTLEEKYGLGRTTAEKVRKEVLAEHVAPAGNSFPEK